jgi:hypothetical protein
LYLHIPGFIRDQLDDAFNRLALRKGDAFHDVINAVFEDVKHASMRLLKLNLDGMLL